MSVLALQTGSALGVTFLTNLVAKVHKMALREVVPAGNTFLMVFDGDVDPVELMKWQTELLQKAEGKEDEQIDPIKYYEEACGEV